MTRGFSHHAPGCETQNPFGRPRAETSKSQRQVINGQKNGQKKLRVGNPAEFKEALQLSALPAEHRQLQIPASEEETKHIALTPVLPRAAGHNTEIIRNEAESINGGLHHAYIRRMAACLPRAAHMV